MNTRRDFLKGSACAVAGKVKGTVWFPAGEYRCHDLKVPPHVMLKGDPVWIFRTEKCSAVLQLDDPKAKCMLDITGAFGVHVYGLMRLSPRQIWYNDGGLPGNGHDDRRCEGEGGY